MSEPLAEPETEEGPESGVVDNPPNPNVELPSPQAVVYGPDGDVLARVPLDEEQTE